MNKLDEFKRYRKKMNERILASDNKQIKRFFSKVSRENENLNLKTISGFSIVLSNKNINQEGRKVFLAYLEDQEDTNKVTSNLLT